MPRFIIKLDDKYLEWSTIVDAPVTWTMDLEGLKQHIRDEYGRSGMNDLDWRLKCVEEFGTSCMGLTVDELIADNRAGDNEKPLTKAEILEKYRNPMTAEPEKA